MTGLMPVPLVLGILAALIVFTAFMCAVVTVAALWVKQVLTDVSGRCQYRRDLRAMRRKPRDDGPSYDQCVLSREERLAFAAIHFRWPPASPAPEPPREVPS